MKYCEKGHENPDVAQFCRVCGCEFRTESGDHGRTTTPNNGDFTLDKFPHIDFEVTDYGSSKPFNSVEVAIGFIFGLMLTGYIFALINSTYKANATFTEKTNSVIKRIASRGHLGLIHSQEVYNLKDKKNRPITIVYRTRLLLPSVYDEIEKMDEIHFLLKKCDRYGIYSVTRKRIIVPVKFDRVYRKYDKLWNAEKNGKVLHYNFNGEIVR